MKIIIDRNNPIIHLDAGKELSVDNIMGREGYKHINPLDIENFEQCKFIGIEFNRLFIQKNNVFVFLEWDSPYPYKSISIKKIGEVIINH